MNDKTIALLQQLAEKLGTTADHLWSVLVRQAPISSTCELIQGPVFIGLLFLAVYFTVRRIRKELAENRNEWIFTNPLWTVLLILSCVVLVIVIFGFLAELPMTVSGFANPEYWALKQIIK